MDEVECKSVKPLNVLLAILISDKVVVFAGNCILSFCHMLQLATRSNILFVHCGVEEK